MNIIEVQNLTKEYGNHRGIFNLNFEVQQGEVVGFLGSNGAGKTTTIRHLMGFIRPQQGISKIFNRNSFYDAAYIQENVGYLPGEISFLDNNMTGSAFIQFMVQIKGNVPKDRLLLCGNVNKLLGELGQYDVKDILVRNQTIEEIFQQYYRE